MDETNAAKEKAEPAHDATPVARVAAFDIFGASDARAGEDELQRKCSKLQNVNAELKSENRELKQKLSLRSPLTLGSPARFKEGSVRALEEQLAKSKQLNESLRLKLANSDQRDETFAFDSNFSSPVSKRSRTPGAYPLSNP